MEGEDGYSEAHPILPLTTTTVTVTERTTITTVQKKRPNVIYITNGPTMGKTEATTGVTTVIEGTVEEKKETESNRQSREEEARDEDNNMTEYVIERAVLFAAPGIGRMKGIE